MVVAVPLLNVYRDRNKKELAWRRVSEVVGVSVEVCKKRWKNLRDTYEVLKILPPPHKVRHLGLSCLLLLLLLLPQPVLLL
uniref:MADF domain-containing protein n=1 Tax=Knipowitschia caucasica TaxID=637954 RepID=A0AAV2K5K1_KNICA